MPVAHHNHDALGDSNAGVSPSFASEAAGGGDGLSRVSVAVRIRPLLGQELSESSGECIHVCAEDRKQVCQYI